MKDETVFEAATDERQDDEQNLGQRISQSHAEFGRANPRGMAPLLDQNPLANAIEAVNAYARRVVSTPSRR